jgi:hypothetical protein
MSRVKKSYQLLCHAQTELGTFTPYKIYSATSSGIRFYIEDDNGRQIPMRNDITSTSHVWDYFEDMNQIIQHTIISFNQSSKDKVQAKAI